MKNISLPAAIAFAALIVGGVVSLVLHQGEVGYMLIGVALGQLGPSPVKLGGAK